jgi:hypothetical protein
MYTRSLLSHDGKLLDETEYKPGDMVSFLCSGAVGPIVEKITDNQVAVLWSDLPDIRLYIYEAGRRINYSQVARSMFPVDPLPQGAIECYLNETVKGEEV